MSWTCKYDINGYCERLHVTCEPTIPGCVLHGKYIRAMDMYPEDNNELKETKLKERNKHANEH